MDELDKKYADLLIEKVKFGIIEDKRIKEQYKKLMDKEKQEKISGIEDFFK